MNVKMNRDILMGMIQAELVSEAELFEGRYYIDIGKPLTKVLKNIDLFIKEFENQIRNEKT